MGQQLAVSARRKRVRPPVAMPGLAHAAAGIGALPPRLGLDAPDTRRDTLVSGAISAAVHVAGLLALIGTALLAPPELIQRVIPVEILREKPPVELPGSNEAPAPAAPKAVGAARPSAAALAAAQAMTPEQARALREAALAAAQRELERLEIADPLDRQTELPTQLARRDAQAVSVAARAATDAVPTTPVDIARFEPVRIDPADLAALPVDLDGPRQVDTRHLAELSTPEAFAALSALDPADYAAAVDPATLTPGAGASPELGTGGVSAVAIDTGANISALGRGAGGGEGFGTGMGTGGTGSAVGVVPCLESKHVLDYLDMIRERTNKRWRIPEGVEPNTEVVLRFDLDAAGMASALKPGESTLPELSESAVQALLQAAPFPPMNENNRCLTEKRIVLTFAVPSR